MGVDESIHLHLSVSLGLIRLPVATAYWLGKVRSHAGAKGSNYKACIRGMNII